MIFYCLKIEYNNSLNWDEFVDITFLDKESNHITFSSLIYENEINIEFNDQVNIVYLLKNEFNSSLENSTLSITLNNIQFQKNFPYKFIQIVLDKSIDISKLEKAMEVLIQYNDNI